MGYVCDHNQKVKEYFAKVEAGLPVEEWGTPFVCDECGEYHHGGMMAARSNDERIICQNCI